MSDVPTKSNATADSAWLTHGFGSGPGRLRLILFPHAGGGPSVYAGWRALGTMLDVRVAALPGREMRITDPPVAELGPIVAALHQAISELDDVPIILFGHSLGALIAFEVAHRMTSAADGRLRGLIASAAAAPHVATPQPRIGHLSDAALLNALARQYGGVASEVLASPELIAFFAPTVRADIRIFESYRHSPRPPLRVPMMAFAGESDPLVATPEVERWRDLTKGTFEFMTFSGGHFFVREREKDIHTAVLAFCRDLI